MDSCHFMWSQVGHVSQVQMKRLPVFHWQSTQGGGCWGKLWWFEMDPSYQTENMVTCSHLRKALEEADKLIMTADPLQHWKHIQ